MSVRVRRATDDDLEEMSVVMTASITELCIADHKDDPVIIASWTRNKSPDGVRAILHNPDVTVLVAERLGALAGVGCINTKGEIGLNYVSPAHRFAGVSRTLLAAMEDALRAGGARIAKLTSTATAHRFYRSAGWEDAGPPETGHPVGGYPMQKSLNIPLSPDISAPPAVIPVCTGMTAGSWGSAR